MVNGIAVAVAGAIALQMLFAGVQGNYTESTGHDLSRAQMQMSVPNDRLTRRRQGIRLAGTRGVRETMAISDGRLGAGREDPEKSSGLTVGDCAALREVAKLPSCRDGDVFAVHGAEYDTDTAEARRGRPEALPRPLLQRLRARARRSPGRCPRDIKKVAAAQGPEGLRARRFPGHPGALPTAAASTARRRRSTCSSTRRSLTCAELVRNAAAKVDPLAEPPGRTRRPSAPTRYRLHPHRAVRRRDLCPRADRGEPAGLAAGAAARAQEAAVGPGRLRHPAPHAEPVGAVADRGPGRPRPGPGLGGGPHPGHGPAEDDGHQVAVDWLSVLAMTGIGSAVVLVVTPAQPAAAAAVDAPGRAAYGVDPPWRGNSPGPTHHDW